MVDKLVQIPREGLPRLRDKYQDNWPKNITSYYTIDSYIKWFEKNPNLDIVKIYSLNGDWQTDGTFLATRHKIIFVGTLEESQEKVRKILGLMDLSKGYTVGCVFPDMKDSIVEVVKLQGYDNSNPDMTYLFFMSKEDAVNLKFDVPDGIILKPLDKSNAEQVNENWPHKHENSVRFIEPLIEYNTSIGAFQGDELVAWCLRLDIGTLALLQVEEKHMRKGYGTLVTLALSKEFGKLGYDVIATVIHKNAKSISLFEKLKFKNLGETFWVDTINFK